MHRRNLLEHWPAMPIVTRMNKAQWHVLIAFWKTTRNCFERDCWAGHITGSLGSLIPAKASYC